MAGYGDFGGGGYFGGENPMGGGGGYGGDNDFGSQERQGGGGGSQGVGGAGKRSGGGARNRENQTMVPLTVGMFKACQPEGGSDGKFSVDGHELYQVKIVGFVREMVPHSTRTMYKIEDSTGLIETTLFSDGDSESEEEQARRQQITEYTYVKVICQPRSYKDELSAQILSIRPITDYNELTYHFLDAIHVHLHRTRGSNSSQANGKGGASSVWGSDGGGSQNNNAFGGGGGASANGFNSGGGGGGGNNNDTVNFTAVQQAVNALYNDPNYVTDEESGLHVKAVVDELVPQGHSERDIKEAIYFLAQEGHLYSTVDEQHYMTTAVNN